MAAKENIKINLFLFDQQEAVVETRFNSIFKEPVKAMGKHE